MSLEQERKFDQCETPFGHADLIFKAAYDRREVHMMMREPLYLIGQTRYCIRTVLCVNDTSSWFHAYKVLRHRRPSEERPYRHYNRYLSASKKVRDGLQPAVQLFLHDTLNSEAARSSFASIDACMYDLRIKKLVERLALLEEQRDYARSVLHIAVETGHLTEKDFRDATPYISSIN